VLQLSGLLAGDVKESRNDNPTRDLQMASDRTRPLSLCGTLVSSHSLSLRNVEELLKERGLDVDHTTVWRWVQYYGPELEQRLRRHLKPTNKSWRVDETYVRVKGRWCYLYRAIDSKGAPSISCCQRSVTPTLPSACFARRSAIDPIANLE
jgi:phosphoglycolate phosphatase-like HAD superfamily hydrolase